MLFWRGYLNAQDVQDFLGVSERTARSLIGKWRYSHLLPPYRHSDRKLMPPEGFKPHGDVSNPDIAFSLLLIASLSRTQHQDEENSKGTPQIRRFAGISFSHVPLLEGGHDLSISAKFPSRPIRQIVSACIRRQALHLIYLAKTGNQEFVFCPAALVRSRGRFHLRGHISQGRDDSGRQLDDQYVDVVPARVIEAKPEGEAPFIGLQGDTDWNTFEEWEFSFSPELTERERLCYEHEYGIANEGVLRIRRRRALIRYIRQELLERRCWRDKDNTSVPIWDPTGSLLQVWGARKSDQGQCYQRH